MKYLIIVLILASCVTPKKAADVLSRSENEPQLSRICAEKFPVQEYYVTGDSVVKYDTLWGVVTDTLVVKDTVTQLDISYIPKVITKTIVRTDTFYRENTAKVSFLNSQISELNKSNLELSELNTKLKQERDEFKDQRNDWRLKFWLLIILLVIYKGVKYKLTKRLW